MYMYVCTYVRMYINTFIHTYMHTYMHTHIHTYRDTPNVNSLVSITTDSGHISVSFNNITVVSYIFITLIYVW